MYYLLLIIATVLFSSQFLFNQKYQQEAGSKINASLVFSIVTSIVSVVLMFIIGGFKIDFSAFSLIIAFIYAITLILYVIASIKAFSVVNLSVYSVFAMLGGMLLPFIYGITFNGEPLTPNKIICCILIGISLFLTTNKNSGNKKGKIYYIAVFFLNGLVGVLSTIHQSNENAVDSSSFMGLTQACVFFIALIIFFVSRQKKPTINVKTICFSSGYALFSGTANLLALIALTKLPASVQYPIITGGTMVFSLFISLLRKEKITIKNILSTIIAFVASIIIAL